MRFFLVFALTLSILLTACGDMLALTAIAVGDKVMRKPTGDVCVDDPSLAYASKAPCRFDGSPITPFSVNDRGIMSSSGYCALEWALVYDREDMVKEALANGANPASCAKNDHSLPFVRALHQCESRHGTNRLNHYLKLLSSQRAIRKFDKSPLLIDAMENDRIDFIQFALDAGWQVNEKVTQLEFGRGGMTSRRHTLLYLSIRQLLTSPTLRTDQTIRFLVAAGAKAGPDINEFIEARQPPVPQEVIDRVNTMLIKP